MDPSGMLFQKIFNNDIEDELRILEKLFNNAIEEI